MPETTISPNAKRGRPAKREAEARGSRVAFRLTLSELSAIQAEAAKAGLSPSDYCRRVILRHRVKPAITDVDAAALADLNRVGVNLNQIAKKLNTTGRAPSDIAATLAEVRAIIDRLGGDR